MDLEGKMKVLEKRVLDAEASNKLNKEEVERLEATLATAQRERNAEKEERIGVEQKTYNNVYEAYECGLNHCI